MSTTTTDTAAAQAALPAAVQAVLAAYTEALDGLASETDAVTAVAQIRRAAGAVSTAETDLLAVAVLAGARITPACYAVGTAPKTLRRYLAEAAA